MRGVWHARGAGQGRRVKKEQNTKHTQWGAGACKGRRRHLGRPWLWCFPVCPLRPVATWTHSLDAWSASQTLLHHIIHRNSATCNVAPAPAPTHWLWPAILPARLALIAADTSLSIVRCVLALLDTPWPASHRRKGRRPGPCFSPSHGICPAIAVHQATKYRPPSLDTPLYQVLTPKPRHSGRLHGRPHGRYAMFCSGLRRVASLASHHVIACICIPPQRRSSPAVTKYRQGLASSPDAPVDADTDSNRSNNNNNNK